MSTTWKYFPPQYGKIGPSDYYGKVSSDGSDIIVLSDGSELELNDFRNISFCYRGSTYEGTGVNRYGDIDYFENQEGREVFDALEERCVNPDSNWYSRYSD